MAQPFSDRVETYFRELPGWQDLRVASAEPLHGGISRESWRVVFEGPSAADGREVILRMDPESSLLESNRAVEAALLRALRDSPDLPVPEVFCSEDDAGRIGASFMALEAMPGTAEVAAIMTPPFIEAGPQIAAAHFDALGVIARVDWQASGLDKVLDAPTDDGAALDAVAQWEAVFRDNSMGPAPIIEAALRSLKSRPPASERISIVHGDFRLGNILYLPDGELSAVLDWEMAHLGDPLEDLAWALNEEWRPSAAPPDLVAGHISEEEAIRAWEKSSGLTADPEALRWWRLFACLKSATVCIAGGRMFIENSDTTIIYAIAGWSVLGRAEALMLDLIGVPR